MKYCSITGVQNKDKKSLRKGSINPISEGNVWMKIACDSGYDVYSWMLSFPVFGYKIDKLGSATIQKTSSGSNIFYIPVTSLLAWTEKVEK